MPTREQPAPHSASSAPAPRAQAPRAPAPDTALQQANAALHARRRDREQIQQRSMLRGLILIALAVLAASIFRAGLHRAFVSGWWKQW